MSAFDWRTLRAVGQGVCMGCVVASVAGTIVFRFGGAGLIGLAVIAGPGLVLLSHFMERRAKRTPKETNEQI
jgi:hypothetical protein